jgi:hypothetical protein
LIMLGHGIIVTLRGLFTRGYGYSSSNRICGPKRNRRKTTFLKRSGAQGTSRNATS